MITDRVTPGRVRRAGQRQEPRWIFTTILLLAGALAAVVYMQYTMGAPAAPAAPAGAGTGTTNVEGDHGDGAEAPSATIPAYAIDPNTGQAIWLSPGGMAMPPAVAAPAGKSGDTPCANGRECPPSNE